MPPRCYASDLATKQDITELRAFIDSRLESLQRCAECGAATDRDSRYMDVKKCAAFLGRTEQAIYALVKRGEIPVIKLGRTLRFDRERLRRWSDRHAQRGKML